MIRHAFPVAVFALSTAFGQQGDRQGHDNMAPVVPEALIPKSPVLSPQEALKSFSIAPGFTIEVFAAEPLVDKPVALDFDPAGRAWVCEMVGYMEDVDGSTEKIPKGRIVVLEDTNHDGRADKRTVFLEKILLPRAIAVYPDGVLYVDDNHLLWAERDGLKAMGEPSVVINGWASGGNPEHKSNGLLRGLDNWLYNAKSTKRIRRVNGEWTVEATANRGQWGISRDDYGRLYHNNNSVFLIGDLVAPNLLMGNPGVDLKVSESTTLGSNQTWPIRVTPGINRAYMSKANGYGDDTLSPETHMMKTATAVSGPVIYRGSNFPSEWYGRGLSPEPAGNLVKAIEITDEGTTLKGSHPFNKSEWLASTDERFRPVNLYNAPDGTVLLLDMYHGLLQHKFYLTTYLRKQYLDRKLDSPPSGVGRIYRIRYKEGPVEKITDLTKLETSTLVRLLAYKNGWHRDMAQRLLIERNDERVVPLLERLVTVKEYPLGAINALWTLEGMGKLTAAPITTALKSEDPKVVSSALWASTRLNDSELAKLAPHIVAVVPQNSEVKVYLARALGPLATQEGDKALISLLNDKDTNKLIRAAAYSGLKGRVSEFKAVAEGKISNEDFLKWLEEGSKDPSNKQPKLPDLKGEDLAAFNRGKALYIGEAACFGCHGPDGRGLPNLGPPLDQSEWVTEDPERLAKILLHGITGPLKVAGVIYNSAGEMPGQATVPGMTDEKLADLSTYIRNEWSNKAKPVSPKVFRKVRAATQNQVGRPYTVDDLK